MHYNCSRWIFTDIESLFTYNYWTSVVQHLSLLTVTYKRATIGLAHWFKSCFSSWSTVHSAVYPHPWNWLMYWVCDMFFLSSFHTLPQTKEENASFARIHSLAVVLHSETTAPYRQPRPNKLSVVFLCVMCCD